MELVDLSTKKCPVCAFTGKHSARNRCLRIGVCSGADEKESTRRKQIYVGCKRCVGEKNIMWRCAPCYAEYSHAIIKKNAIINEIMNTLFSIDWSNLSKVKALNNSIDLPKNIIWIICPWDSFQISLLWKHECPSCYELALPTGNVLSIPNSMKANILGPRIKMCRIINLRSRIHICKYTNRLIEKTVRIGVVMLEPIMDVKSENDYIYKQLGDNHNGYCSIEHMFKCILKRDYEYLDWLLTLVPSGENPNYNAILSLKKLNAFSTIFDKGSTTDRETVSANLLKCTRLIVEEVKDNSYSRKNNNNMIKKNINQSKYRVGRSSGPYGTINGITISKLRQIYSSGNISNSIPRNVIGTIIVPYYNNEKSSLITKIIPYYSSVNSINHHVTKPKHNAPPRKGWISTYKKLHNFFFKKQERFLVKQQTVDVIQEESRLLLSSALILRELHNNCANLFLQTDTFMNTLNYYGSCINEDIVDLTQLYQMGRISTVIEATSGHKDNYIGLGRKKTPSILQSKVTLCLGNSTTKSNESVGLCGSVPIGALAYPRYQIYTNCNPMEEVEIHSLQNIVHVSRGFQDTNYRGSLSISKCNNLNKLYMNGCCITHIP